MIKYITAFLLIFTPFSIFAQADFEPQILIISPYKTNYDKSFEDELTAKNKEIQLSTQKAIKENTFLPYGFKFETESIQTSYKSQLEYSKNLDFFKNVSSTLLKMLLDNFKRNFNNPLITLKDTTSVGLINDLRKIAKKENVQYVVNFPLIELYKDNETSYAAVTFQLFDKVRDAIILENTFSEDWSDRNLMLLCTDKTIDCCVKNALHHITLRIQEAVKSNSTSYTNERNLFKERSELLAKNYLYQPFDKHFLDTIIPKSDSSISISSLFQLLVNPNRTMFAAFFSERITEKTYQYYQSSGKIKGDVNFYHSLDTPDTALHSYSYIVSGVKYNNKWYYEKSNIFYTDARSDEEGKKSLLYKLTNLNFFKDNSTEINPDFWETKLFEKVSTVPNNSFIPRYKEFFWKVDSINYKDYIGLTKIVAKKTRKEKRDSLRLKDMELINTYFEPLITKLNYQKKYEVVSLKHKFFDHIFVNTSDRKIILCPVNIKERGKDSTLKYFVLLQDQNNSYKLYEWNYFNSTDNSTKDSGHNLKDQINSLTYWEYSIDAVDESKFWNEYVLKQSGGKYSYLKEVQ